MGVLQEDTFFIHAQDVYDIQITAYSYVFGCLKQDLKSSIGNVPIEKIWRFRRYTEIKKIITQIYKNKFPQLNIKIEYDSDSNIYPKPYLQWKEIKFFIIKADTKTFLMDVTLQLKK